jgi:hypothetical protein
MRVRILTIINNFGEEKFIVQYTEREQFFIFWTKEVWKNVTFTQTNDPFFYDSRYEAVEKAKDMLINANPRQQRIVTVANAEEVTI